VDGKNRNYFFKNEISSLLLDRRFVLFDKNFSGCKLKSPAVAGPFKIG
jgi:hypothetical protein